MSNKIFNANQLKHIDEQTVIRQRITSVELMERASLVLFQALENDFDLSEIHTCILCGTGNNGGDGLALARHLYRKGYDFSVYLYSSSGKYSNDNQINQNHLKDYGISIHNFDLNHTFDFSKPGIIVDCLFGYGLNRPLGAEWSNVIEQINQSNRQIVACDLPSGLLINEPSSEPIVRSNLTYTFECAKLGLLLPSNASYVNEFRILSIQLDEESMDAETTDFYYITETLARSILKPLGKFSHKGTFGHALIIGGSYGKMGACILSARAGLKSGCGLVTTYIPKCGYAVMQSSFPEAIVLTDENEKLITSFPDISPYSSIGIGIGIGTDDKTAKAFELFLQRLELNKIQFQGKVVLDADALNLLSLNPKLIELLPKNTILTPHPKELERLIGSWEDDFDKFEKTIEFTAAHQVIVLIKGAHTAVCLPNGSIYFNSTGNPGMATGGSGDVLTGIITSLLSQKYSPEEAAVLGVYLHGKAGDSAIEQLNKRSLIASDIIDYISKAYNISEVPFRMKI